MADKKICWMASYPRSGSTWLRLMLEHYYTGELPFKREGDVVRGDNAHKFYTNISPWGNLDGEKVDIYAVLRPAAVAWMASHWQVDKVVHTKNVCLKTHNGNYPIARIPLIPPSLTERAIVLARDPRDVACSLARYLGMEIQQAVDSLCDTGFMLTDPDKPPTILGSWDTWCYSWATAQDFPVAMIKYEDVVRNPVEQLTVVLSLVGEGKPDDTKIRASVEACSLEHLKYKEKKEGFIAHMGQGDFFRKGLAGSWHKELTIKQANQIEKECARMMEACGYL